MKPRIRYLMASQIPSKLDKLAEEAAVVIFETESKAPLKARQTRLIITPTVVSIIKPHLLSKEEYPIPLSAIRGARIYESPIFSSLTIEVYRYKKPPVIKYLSSTDARMARRYIMALVACKDNQVDLTKYSANELREKLLDIGKVEK